MSARPADARDLHAWAEERQVAHLLTRPARDLVLHDRDRLLPVLFRAFSYRSAISVQDLLLERPVYVDTNLDLLRAAVVDGLERASLRIARGVAYERSAGLTRPRSPRGPEADVILEPLTALRAALRSDARPYDPDDLPEERRLRFALSGRVPMVTFELEEPHAYARVRVRIPIELHAPLRAECSEHLGACDHTLMAVDELLRHLTRDPPPKELAALMALAETPPWMRALAELEAKSASAAAATPDEGELSWWIRASPHAAWSIAPVLRKRGKRGDWLSPKTARASTLLAGQTPLSDVDRRVAQLVVMVEQSGRSWDVGLVVEALVGHPRVIAGPRLDDAEPWKVELHDARVQVTRERKVLRAQLVVEGHAIAGLHEREVLMDAEGQRVVLARVPKAVRTSLERVSDAITKLPPQDLPAFAARLALLDPSLGVEAVDLVPVEEIDARDAWVLRLASRDDGGLEASLWVQPIEDGPRYRAGEAPARAIAPIGRDRLVAALRDLEDEQAGAARRWAAWGVGPSTDAARLFMDHDELLRLLAGVRSEPRGTVVEWTTKPIRVLPKLRTRQLRFNLASGPDWFAVEGEGAVEDHRATLAMLLDAARKKSDFVRVSDDTWMELESEVSERLRAMEPYVRNTKGRMEVGALSVPALAEVMGEINTPPAWIDVVRRAREAGGQQPPIPAALQAELRPYQAEGFVWMARLAAWGAGAVLADDMGLGKTVQTIALLLHRAAEGPALVIAPTSVTHNWRRELARFAPSLTVRSLRAAGGGVELSDLGPGMVVVTSYGLTVIEQEALVKRRFATLVIDEAQVIKNPASQRSKAVRALQAGWRIALTGTPVENHLGDLWAVMAAVAPGLLGSWESFRERWMGATGSGLDGLRRLVRPFVLRRSKADVLTELPPKTEVVIDVELSAPERRIYEDARLAATAELRGLGAELGSAAGRFHVLAAITRLRQLASDAALVVSDAEPPPSSKLARFADLAAALVEEGHSAIAFSQFVRLLDRAELALSGRGVPFSRLDGSTPSEARGDIVDRFQSGGPSLLLVSLRAGGTGLNLTAADHVFHLDPWWNPAVEDQATDRAHRIGQTKPVTVFRMVSRGTIEAAILGLHADKRGLAAAILEGGSTSEAVSAEALVAMIEEGASAPLVVEEEEPAEVSTRPVPRRRGPRTIPKT